MAIVPQYALSNGAELTLHRRDMLVRNRTQSGYSLVESQTNQTCSISFLQLAEFIKSPGTRIQKTRSDAGDRITQRLGGYTTSKSLSFDQQENGRFNFCLCSAIQGWRDEERRYSGNPNFDVSINKLDQRENRIHIKKAAEALFGKTILIDSGKGGTHTSWTMHRGRTLIKYFRRFESLAPDENPMDALVTLEHLRGNRARRISHRVCELMTQAWQEIGFDNKSTSPANVMRHLEVLIREENALRKRNNLQKLIRPSPSVLLEHRKSMMTPLEYLIATKGERYSKNKRGRGSTDFRALLIGEYCEIDECKASLISSAKAIGTWESLSSEDKDTLEKVDKWIRSRLTILVMIDVASRMPLAWVISDQPKAIATLELLRMATRDKMRERNPYGCKGFPAAATGILHIKSDNGIALRNSRVLRVALGMNAIFTIARAYSATDKPYVERMFGTVESVLLKIIHGYTGRKPGELPGYDAVKNGALVIDELYGILTRFLIDEYPSMRHAGADMAYHRPHEVYQRINQDRGQIPPLDPVIRRIHLGFEEKVTPSDEGVRVFGGIWFNSDQFQRELEECRNLASGHTIGKIPVFVDPDDMSRATALLPGVKEPIEVFLQITAFADLTLPEILEDLSSYRKENPQVTEIYEDMIMSARRDRHEQLKAIGVERGLSRSFSTVEECRAKAANLLRGSRLIPTTKIPFPASSGTVSAQDRPRISFPLGDMKDVVEGEAIPVQQPEQSVGLRSAPETPTAQTTMDPSTVASKAPRKAKKGAASLPDDLILGRPKQLKELE